MSEIPYSRRIALGATALVLLLTACGQRGPLYLPKKTRTEITPAAPAAPTAPADPDSKSQDDGTAAAPASPSSPPSAP
jgi:predicted small lipoprotein YifL